VTAAAGLAWLGALREPQQALAWDLAQWSRVLRQARRLRLMGRLAHALAREGLMDQVPAQPARLLRGEWHYAAQRGTALTWALAHVGAALDGLPGPRLLLKGAAYVGQGLALGEGRLPSDVDILVPRAVLDAAQQRLRASGWVEAELDAHDQHYYREWSHELPPLRHAQHRLELDLHHDILPPVARTRVDIGRLLADARPAVALPGWQVFAPVDQVLHSAAHLFFDSELRDRIRDLVDLDALMRHFGAEAGFWDDLARRAAELGLRQPLALALHFCRAWLGTPVPAGAAAVLPAPTVWERAFVVPLFAQVLWPHSPDEQPSALQGWAGTALLARHHWWRMPMGLLVPHLWHKLRGGDATGAG
jgi:hypothetical protein